ncbi:hemagglutinin repeat-containing protein [Pseudomonas sp. Fl4BN1]|uniref:hemagglutinin repeat-containing protein n=1 Tax=Pseudomonas sp. Fl4BN1 TaxID=2697651 RepID=UPI0013776D7C|nr:hemagglutinin repeat-containing protein [Pseudomonas sp. Fl4BN1]NBF10566.1 filamentous hemagglutinin N-terminal domain-containing protein [Pseudomonas sp. Fl4BN1]
MDVRKPFAQCIALSLSGVLFLNPIVSVAAGLTLDPAAGGNATIGAAGNGVPVVNINAANGSGLSHNKFSEYNVGSNGLILNNATGSTQSTQLGGYIIGNPNLKGQAAQVILNEVTGSNRSKLAGYTEVAGQAARVIVANPHGITCNGCGFINTPRATLTTGKPVLEGQRLDRFQVDGGDISIEGADLNASNLDQFDLITRSTKLNANLYAKKLNIITGRNDVKADDLSVTARAADASIKPELAIDSSVLGGMYAGAIRLVGTEKGVGVNMSAEMAASTGDIQIDANGKVTVANMGAKQAIAVTAQSIDLQGKAYAGTEATLQAKEQIKVQTSLAARDRVRVVDAAQVVNYGIIEAGVNADNSRNDHGEVKLTGNNLENQGSVLASRSLELEAREALSNQNGVIQGPKVQINAARLVNQGDKARVLARNELVLDTPAIANLGGLIRFGDQQAVTLTLDNLNNNGGRLEVAGASLTLSAGEVSNQKGSVIADKVQISADRLDNQHGLIGASQGSATFKISDQLNNNAGQLQALTLLETEGGELLNQGGKLLADQIKVTGKRLDNSQKGLISAEKGALEISLDQDLLNAGGKLQATSLLSLKAASVDNRSGTLVAPQLTLNSSGKLDNQGGTVDADGLELHTADIDNQSGLLQGKERLLLEARDLANNQGRVIGNVLTASLDSLSQNQGGALSAENGKLTLTVKQHLNNALGHLQAKQGDVQIESAGLANQGGVVVGNQLLLTNSGLLDNRGGQLVGDRLTVTTQRLDNRASGLLAAGTDGLHLTLSTDGVTPGQLLNSQGRLQSDGHLQIDGGQLHNSGGVLLGNSIGINAAGLDNSTKGAVVANNGTIDLTLNNGALNNNAGMIDAGEQKLRVSQVAQLDNLGGTLKGKRLEIDGAAVDNRQGQLLAGSAGLNLVAGGLNNAEGMILAKDSHGEVALGQGTLDNRGGTLQGATLGVTAGAVDNSALNGKAGLISSQAGALKLVVDRLTNQAGKLYASGLLSSVGQTLDNRWGGEISAQQLDLTAHANLSNQGGLVESANGLLLAAGNLDNSAGGRVRVVAGEQSRITLGGTFNNQGGSLASGSSAFALSAGQLNNESGTVEHAGNALFKLDLGVLSGFQGRMTGLGRGDWDIASINRSGLMQLNGELDLSTGADLNLNAGDRIASATGLRLAAATLNNAGELASDGYMTLELGGNLNNSGLLSSRGKLTVGATDLNQNGGRIASGGDTQLNLRGTLDNLGRLIASQNLNVSAAQINNRGTLGALGQMQLRSSNGITTSADTLIYSGADMLLRGNGLANSYGDIYSAGNLSFAALDGGRAVLLSNRSGTIESQGDMNLNVATLVNAMDKYDVSESIARRSIAINCTDCSGKHHSAVYTVNTTYQNTMGEHSAAARLVSNRDLTINADTVENQLSLIAANRDAFVTANNFYNRGLTLDQRVEAVNYTLFRLKKSAYRFVERETKAWNSRNSGRAPDQQDPLPAALLQYKSSIGSNVILPGTQTGYSATLQAGERLHLQVGGTLENGTLSEQARAQLTGQTLQNSLSQVGGQTITVNAQSTAAAAQVAKDVQRIERVAADGTTQVSFVPVDFSGVPFAAVDPTALSSYRVPQGEYGLFIKSQNPQGRYLIETNPTFTDLSRFMSSDYMLGHLNYSTDQTWRRLGDGLYETRLIRDAVLAQTGQRFLASGLTSDYDQYRYLMDNAIASKDRLNLSVGVSLSSAQVASLTHDIVWMETREVQGEKVLVPVLYLAQADSRNLRGGSLIQGRDMTLVAGGDLTNVGTLRASNDLKADVGGNLYQGGLIEANERVSLMAQDSVRNALAGEIRGNQVSVSAIKGDILNDRVAVAVGYGAGTRTILDQGGQISARQQLDLTAGRDLTNKGQIASAGDAKLSAGRDIDLLAVQDHTFTQNAIRRGLVTNDTVQTLGSSVTAGGNLELKAGRDLAVVASKVSAGHDLSLGAERDMVIASAQDEQSSTFYQKKKGSWGKSKTTRSADSSTTNVASEISAGHDLMVNVSQDKDGRISLNGGRDVTVVGSQLNAGNDLLVGAARDVSLVSAQEQQDSSYSQKKKGSFGLNKSGNSRTSSSTTQVGSELSAGNDAVVIAGTNVNLSASSIEAKRDAEVRAGLIDKSGDINLMDAANTSSSQSDKYKSKVGFSSSGTFISVASSKKSGQENQQSQSVGGVVSAGRDTTLHSARDVNMIGSTAAAERNLNVGAGRDVNVLAGSNSSDQSNWKSSKQVGLSLESDRNGVTAFLGSEGLKQKSRNAQETVAPSQLLAGQDVSVNAGRDLTVEGSRVDAKRDVNLQAGHDININAGDEHSLQESSKSRDRNGLTVNVSHNYGKTMDALKGTGKGEDGVSKASSVLSTVDAINQFTSGPTSATHFGSASQSTSSRQQVQTSSPSSLGAGRDISAVAGNDVSIRGSHFDAGRDITVVGRDVTVDVARGSVSEESKTARSQGGINGQSGGGSARAGIGGSNGVASESLTQGTNSPSVLLAGRDVSFEARDNLTLIGTQVQAGRDIDLGAGKDLTIRAAQNDSSSESSRRSGGGEVGLALGGKDFISVYASVDMGKGKLERENQKQQNAQLVAGDQLRFTSGKDTTIAGATLRGNEVVGRVGGDLMVSSVPDTGKVSGKQSDLSVTVSIGLGGGGSVSGSAGVGKTTGKTNWVQEQTSITGKNGVDIRTENHTQIDGALVAADNGNLKLDTNTLGFRDISGQDKEHSYYLNVGGTFGWGASGDGANQATTGKQVAFTNDKSLEGKGKTGASGWSVSGYDYRKEREQEVRATVGAGNVVVRNDAKTGQDSTAGLNRDVSQAYEITKDKEKRTDLYVTQSSLDAVSHPGVTLDNWQKGMSEYGKNASAAFTQYGDLSKATQKALADNPGLWPLAWIPGALEKVMDSTSYGTLGLMPGVASHGGVATQLPVLLSGDMSFYRAHAVYLKDEHGNIQNDAEGKPMLDLAKTIASLTSITQPDGSGPIATNGIQNSRDAALVNGGMQTGQDTFIQAYNPEHGFLGDLLESAWDVLLGGTIKSGNAQQLHNFFEDGIKQGFVLSPVGHSQGALLTYRAIDGLNFNVGGDIGVIQFSGAPVGVLDFYKAAEKSGFDEKNAFFQINRPDTRVVFGLVPFTDSVSDLLGNNAGHSASPVLQYVGAVVSLPSLIGLGPPSAHSNYLCISKKLCGGNASVLQEQFKKSEAYITPTLLGPKGNVLQGREI